MKAISLQATAVHGYLDIDIHFNEGLTFLVGLNGSGKTTALNLLMALASPNLETLSDTNYKTVELKVKTDRELSITSSRNDGQISINISGTDETYSFEIPDTEILETHRHRTEYFARQHSEARSHPVIAQILHQNVPMFLGLDRRFLSQERVGDRGFELTPRAAMLRGGHLRGDLGAGLADVQVLVRDKMAEIRSRQSTIETELRRKIILDSFSYAPVTPKQFGLPTKDMIQNFKTKRAAIEQAAGSLGVPQEEVEGHLTKFFERMEKAVNTIEEAQKLGTKNKKDIPTDTIVEWFINKPQVDRINSLFKAVEEFSVQKTEELLPIEGYLSLVNQFLSQTGKRLALTTQDYLGVQLESGERRSISALSSGERQIVVMLAHLALNKRTEDGGVFIIDEPELSLHISWQEKFVDAILKANPKTQFILATHSPAIILGRDTACIEVENKLGAANATLAQ